MDLKHVSDCLAFIQRAEALKDTLRTGYTAGGRQESTAEHTWRLCLLTMVLAPYFEGADADKLLRLALVHDLAEAVCGDIPATAQTADDGKLEAERQGMHELCEGLPQAIRDDMLALWEEYEAVSTLESKIVKGLDKLETIIQHNQGDNPPDFRYAFNLGYARESTSALPLLEQIREMVDETTRERAAGQQR